MPDALSRPERVALGMLAGWMGDRYFRTFRPADDAPGPFDALLTQRDRRVGVTTGVLWEGENRPAITEFETLAGADLATGPANTSAETPRAATDGEAADGAFALWVPPGGELPRAEPRASEFRLLVTRGVNGLHPGERREIRIPVRLSLAQISADGAYVSVVGGLASKWTDISEGIEGAYHLDSREVHRLSGEPAEADIVLTRIRDRAALLQPGEVTTVEVHDYWVVSRIPGDQPPGLTVMGAPPEFDAGDGAHIRRLLRRAITRATEQRRDGQCDLAALVLAAPVAHMTEERVTAALRGMNPGTYAQIDLIAIVGDGQVRQVLQPRTLPWETQ